MTTDADLKAEVTASTSDSSSKQSAAASITASVKSAGQVVAEYKHYSKYAPKRFPKTISEGAKWAETSLTNYAKDNGKKWGAQAIAKVASAYGYEGYVPSEIPTNEKECGEALVNIACVAASSELGVDPRIAKVTVEAVMDGKLDKNDCESIGATAGSIAGAAICQAYGIPAPIGAFLGGEIGGFIGGEIADIFGASKKAHREWLDKQKRIVAQIQAKAEDQCAQIRQGYWNNFDATLRQAELTWENLELKAGYRFDVRWFGRSPTPNFLEYVQQQAAKFSGRIGAESCAVVCADGYSAKKTTAPWLMHASPAEIAALKASCDSHMAPIVAKRLGLSLAAAKAAIRMAKFSPVESCGIDCIADYGCLYPDMTPYAKYPTIPGALSSAKRVTSAYYALGFPWYPHYSQEQITAWGVRDQETLKVAILAHPGEVRNVLCTLPAASSRAVSDTKYRKLWVEWLNTMLALEINKIDAFNSASVRLFGDLTQTAAMVAVQAQISDAKTRAALKGLGTNDPSISSASSWVNNGALVAGLGWLAYNARSR